MDSRAKPIRSALFVPADREEMLRKAARYGADALIADLEDGVAEQNRDTARANLSGIVEALGAAGQTVIVRVNSIESGLTGFDLEAVTGSHLYAVMLPKVAGPDDVRETAHLLNFLERKNGVEPGATLIWPLLETAVGIYRAYETGIASVRVAHMGGIGGSGDVGRALGYQATREGLETLYLLSKVLLEARAAGVPFPIGGAGSGENIREYKGCGRNPRRGAAGPTTRLHRIDAAPSRGNRRGQRGLHARRRRDPGRTGAGGHCRSPVKRRPWCQHPSGPDGRCRSPQKRAGAATMGREHQIRQGRQRVEDVNVDGRQRYQVGPDSRAAESSDY